MVNWFGGFVWKSYASFMWIYMKNALLEEQFGVFGPYFVLDIGSYPIKPPLPIFLAR